MTVGFTEQTEGALDVWLEGIVEHIAELLPAQGPIGIFIHHNTLHAFESLDFEEAVVSAADKLSCEPFLSEDEYRREFKGGRISNRDLEWALRKDLGSSADQIVCGQLTRIDLRANIAKCGIPKAEGPALSWQINETSVLQEFGQNILPKTSKASRPNEKACDLWTACLEAVQRVPEISRPAAAKAAVRHRDLLLAVTGTDTDAWAHPVLIRFLGAFLDQGLARWSLPNASQGLYASFLELYSHRWSGLCGRWAASLPSLIRQERRLALNSSVSLQRSLNELGVNRDEASAFLEATALALRGWAGMIRQIEKRPDRVPVRSKPASLMEYLAVRLLLERTALSYAIKQLPNFKGGLAELPAYLRESIKLPQPASPEKRSWILFHAAQLCGLTAKRLQSFSDTEIHALEIELNAFDEVGRRRILHSAYDHHLGSRLCDALSAHKPVKPPSPALFQAIFCLDEREESFRRHLEETEPGVETLGAAGFFGVAMYYQGATDAHPRPLCPIAIEPVHYVGEIKADPLATAVRWRRMRRRETGRLGKFLHLFSGTFIGGYLISALLGPLSIVPLVFRVVFPGLAKRWVSILPYSQPPPTRLLLDRQPGAPPIGRHRGYTKEEMAGIVSDLLRSLGIAKCLAPIVVVVGHGSISLNNPHESAHDCGACGGGRGGPNARAFAQMANDASVRNILAKDGLLIPKETWFIGAVRNTCDNSVEFFDLQVLPKAHEPLFNRIAGAFTQARRKEAHERCRRFKSFPLSGSRGAALAHVETRAHDLAQPRPEYGHASNAFCIVGRRSRTKGLFLDRRAFLVSYDPTQDDDLGILERTLAAVTPVVAGISLEYYFSRVDPSGYGCATKLPHNVTCLLGVMDGAQSDLRTGLPWQMVEIHEPTRLFMIVECRPQSFDVVLERLTDVKKLLDGRWMFAACLDPQSQELWLRERGGYQRWNPEHPLPFITGDSLAWYQGKRGHLPIAEIVPSSAAMST